MKKVYISGKITGIEKEAPALFEKAEQEVRAMGFEPVNPMKLNHEHDLKWSSYMRVDLRELSYCDAVYMMSNYQDSKGAKGELDTAILLQLDVMFQHRNVKV